MLESLRAWLQPPVLASQEHTQRARTFWEVSWGISLLATLFIVVFIVLQPESRASRSSSLLFIAVQQLGLHALNRRGTQSS